MFKRIQRMLAEFAQFSADRRKQCATILHGQAMIIVVQFVFNKDATILTIIIGILIALALWIAAVKIVP